MVHSVFCIQMHVARLSNLESGNYFIFAELSLLFFLLAFQTHWNSNNIEKLTPFLFLQLITLEKQVKKRQINACLDKPIKNEKNSNKLVKKH